MTRFMQALFIKISSAVFTKDKYSRVMLLPYSYHSLVFLFLL